MSKEKYLSLISPQMEAIVFIIVHIFLATLAVLKLGDILTNSPVVVGINQLHDMFRPIAHEQKYFFLILGGAGLAQW